MTVLPSIDTVASSSSSSGTKPAPAVRDSASTSDTSRTRELEKLQRAAKDFEAVFLRQMLSALERTTKVGDKGPNVAGQQAYGSMIVEAVADAVVQAGGIGLSHVLSRVLEDRVDRGASDTSSISGSPGPSTGANTITNAPLAAATRRGSSHVGSLQGSAGAANQNSSQGSPSTAVPWTESRTIDAQAVGPLADRRIR